MDDMHSVKRQRDLAELAAAMAEYDSAQSDPVENAIRQLRINCRCQFKSCGTGSGGVVMNDAPPIEEPVPDSEGQITDDLAIYLYFKRRRK